jgi:hypothetical protein
MTDAPETIWAWPHDDKRGWYAGGCSTEVNLGMLGKQADEQSEYTRTDISQEARIAELEAALATARADALREAASLCAGAGAFADEMEKPILDLIGNEAK